MPAADYDFDASADDELDLPATAVEVKSAPSEPRKKAQEEPATATVDAKARGKEAPQHNPMSLRFAKEFDFTDEEIAEMTPRELDIAVQSAHKQWLRHSKELSRNAEKPKPPAEVEVSPPTPAKVEPAAEPDEYAEFEEELHPSVLKAIKKGRESDKKVIEALQKQVEEMHGQRQVEAREQVYNQVDAEFAKMPAAVKALIGDGGRNEIEDGSLQHTVRVHILKAAEKDQTPGISFAQKMHKAAKALVPGSETAAETTVEEPAPAPAKKPAQPKAPDGRFASKPVEEREEAWKKSGTAKPTQRESPLPSGEQKAMQTARKLMLERGLLSEDDMPSDSFLAAA